MAFEYEECRDAIKKSKDPKQIGMLVEKFYSSELATAESLRRMDKEIDDLIARRGEAKRSLSTMEAINPIRSVAGDRLIVLSTGDLFEEKRDD